MPRIHGREPPPRANRAVQIGSRPYHLMSVIRSGLDRLMPAWMRARSHSQLLSVGIPLMFSACATSRVDWNSCIGSYTYDQAVRDLGLPARFTMLSDNTNVADWLTSQGSTMMVATPRSPVTSSPFNHSNYSLPLTHPSNLTYSTLKEPSYYLRLIFGPDLKLKSWERLTR
jgi:hypothetical protein